MTQARGTQRTAGTAAIRGAALGTLVALLASCAAPSPPVSLLAPAAPEARPANQAADSSPAPQAEKAGKEEYVNRRVVELPLDKTALAGRKGAELWFTPDLGKTWVNHGPLDLSRASVVYVPPSDGRYGFVVVPLGDGGRRETTPKPGDAPAKIHVVDTVPPVVELLSPNGGELLGAGKSTIVQWVAEDANVAPAGVTLEVSTDGKTWTAAAKDLPNTGKYHWDLSTLLSSTTIRVRIVVRDLAGNVGLDASDRDFTIDGLSPDLRITGPASTGDVPVRIEWTGGDLGGSGLKRVVLWVTRDGGQSWKLQGEDEDLRSPFEFAELDGVYGLRLTGEDRVGNAGAPPVPGTQPQHVLTVDRTKPEVKLLAPAAGGYLAGVPIEIQWAAKDNLGMPVNGIELEYSPDDGKTWSEIAKGVKNDGLYSWKAPRISGTDYRVRLTAVDLAGNRIVTGSPRFGIDAAVPEARALSPDRSGAHSVQVAYEIKNRGSAPLKKVTLYYRPEHVKEWIKYGDDPDGESPMLFAKADGKYALYMTCATEAGLKGGSVQKAPEEGTDPQLVLTIDATPPQVALKTFTGGGFYMGGAAVDLQWSLLEPNPEPRGVTIHHSPDGGASWNLVAERVDAAKGAYRWIIPAATGARHRLRVTAQDLFGNRGQAESEKPFTIDSDLPVAVMLEKPPAVVRSTHLALRYKASDATSGLEKVVLYGRRASDKGAYKTLAETQNLEGTLEVDLPGEGLWNLLLCATDVAGHPSTDVERSPRPDAVVAVDLTKPELALKSSMLPQGAKTWISPNWEVLWTASDTLSSAEKISLRIEHSSDGGKTWFVAIGKHPNTGHADLRAHLFPGKKYRLRLVALDEAGNEAEESTGDFDPGDVPPPALVLRGIEDGRSYVAGSSQTVLWSSPDKTIRDAALELSKDGGRTWSLYAAMSTPSMKAVVPDKEGRYHFRVTSRDGVGRPLSSNYVSFDVISGVEQVRLIANPTAEPNKLVRILIEPKGVLKTAKELRLEISENAKDWRPLGEVRGADMTFPAPGIPGDYVLRIVVQAAEGREYDSNHAKLQVVGKGAVAIRLNSFRGGQAYAGGTGRIIAVEGGVDPAGLRVELSDKSGQDGSWKDITADLQRVRDGFFWKLPMISKETCRLRVSMKDAQGKVLSDASEKDFSIESGAKAPVGVEAPVQPPKKDPAAVEAPSAALRLETILPAALKGGAMLELKWRAVDPAAKVTVSLMIGEKAQVLLKDQAAQGAAPWEIPRIDARGCTLKLSSGTQIWVSKAFDIRSTAPIIDGVDIELPRK